MTGVEGADVKVDKETFSEYAVSNSVVSNVIFCPTKFHDNRHCRYIHYMFENPVRDITYLLLSI